MCLIADWQSPPISQYLLMKHIPLLVWVTKNDADAANLLKPAWHGEYAQS